MDAFRKLKEAVIRSANEVANGIVGTIKGSVSEYLNRLGKKTHSTGNGLTAGLSSPSSYSFYDMKPAFARSKKVKYTPAGNWYLIVPIHRQTKSMDSYVYKQAMAMQSSISGVTERIEGLYGDRTQVDSPYGAVPFNTDTGGNLTRYQRNGYSDFIAFRTVSSKSPSNSWIRKINVSKKEENSSLIAKLDELIERLMSKI